MSYRSLITVAAIVSLLICLPVNDSYATQQTVFPFPARQAVLDLIKGRRYDDAITPLEQVLERDPENGEALTYLATVNMYLTGDFFKARDDFKVAFKAGGGATFFVNHVHDKVEAGDIVDYCRGWLHLRKNSIEFVSLEGNHGFKLQSSDITESAINKSSKRTCHFKTGGKNQNFRGRSNTELEPLLIVALYKSFNSN